MWNLGCFQKFSASVALIQVMKISPFSCLSKISLWRRILADPASKFKLANHLLESQEQQTSQSSSRHGTDWVKLYSSHYLLVSSNLKSIFIQSLISWDFLIIAGHFKIYPKYFHLYLPKYDVLMTIRSSPLCETSPYSSSGTTSSSLRA